ncbi:MAG: GNAT family N-acetyltransferase [Cytophagaceae bacterium]
MEFQLLVSDKLSFQELSEKYPLLLSKGFHKKVKSSFYLSGTVSIIALYEKKAVGLLVLALYSTNIADLFSLYVNKNFRRKGLARAMLKLLEKKLLQLKISHYQAIYQSDWVEKDLWEKFLSATGWAKPEKKFALMKINLATLRDHSDWLKNLPPPHDACEIIPWKEIEPQVRSQYHQMDFPSSLNPEQMPEKIAPFSFGAVAGNLLLGWIITHYTKNDIQYTSLYVIKHKKRGLIALNLLKTSGYAQLNDGFTNAVYMIDVQNENMLKIHHKRFKEYSFFTEHLYKTTKYLTKQLL